MSLRVNFGRLRGLSARIIALTLVALVVSQLVSYWSYRHGREDFIAHVISDYASQSVISVSRGLDFAPAGRQAALARALSNPSVQFDLVAAAPSCRRHGPSKPAYARDFAQRLHVAVTRVRVCVGGPGARPRPAVTLAVQRGDGRWLVARQRLPHPKGHWARQSLRNIAITAVIMLVVVVAASRRITRPLRDLAFAAERFGRGETIAPVVERGSDEIRRSIAAFNRMHARIERFVAERTRLVAALAHDLRTPITALRLRLEFLPDDEHTRAMRATLGDMAEMSEAALTFMREEARSEPSRHIDLTALVDAVCEDYRASGRPVRFEPAERITLICRPVAIRRALRNVVDNALAYGTRATITLDATRDAVRLDVVDAGPGIPEAELANVFDAFVRLESSRSRETGGAGLGLAIARSVVRGHGGDITLSNPSEGGLRVSMRFPRPRTA